ncbi:MAG: hypothetical protein LBG06_02180 [Deltaproteobacteria bacterium]|nr:hypothetical protein [Deltaproteobacteria bacterium]
MAALFGEVGARIDETRDAAIRAMGVAAGSLTEVAGEWVGRVGERLETAAAGLAAGQDALFERACKRLDESLGQAMARLAQEAARLSEEVRQRSGEMLQSLSGTVAAVGDGQRELHYAMLGHIDEGGTRLRGALSGIADAQQGVYSQLVEKLEIYNRLFADILATVRDGQESLIREIKGKYSEISEMYAKTTEGFTSAAEAVNAQTLGFVDGQRKLLEGLHASGERVWEGQKAVVQDMRSEIDRMLGQFRDHIAYLENSYEKHNEMYGMHLAEAKDGLKSLRDVWAGLDARFGGIDGVLDRTLDKLHNSYLHNIGEAERYLHDIDKSFAEAVGALRETVAEMNSAARHMAELRA